MISEKLKLGKAFAMILLQDEKGRCVSATECRTGLDSDLDFWGIKFNHYPESFLVFNGVNASPSWMRDSKHFGRMRNERRLLMCRNMATFQKFGADHLFNEDLQQTFIQ